jgi:hypothetical protein
VTSRTVEDRLREEYFLLSPEIRRVLHQLQTDIAYLLLPAERVYGAFEELEDVLKRELQRNAAREPTAAV